MDTGLIHQAYGLNITSEIRLSELEHRCGTPDVVIRFGPVSLNLDDAVTHGLRFQASSRQFLLTIDKIARFLVSDGRMIQIDPEPGADGMDLRTFLSGSVMGALLQQRGVFLLHGTAVCCNGKAVVFAGPSGVGKSTLAAACCQQGALLLTDELCAVTFSPEGTPYVLPGYPVLRLWAKAVELLKLDADMLNRERRKLNKYRWEIPDLFHPEPVPLTRLYLLHMANCSGYTMLSSCKNENIVRLAGVRNNVYWFDYVADPFLKAEYLRRCADIVRTVDIRRLNCPIDHSERDVLISFVTEKLMP